jgi:ribosomal protein S18 acetylase RimI-like enzyme
MKITSTRIATAADAKAVAELANAHELSVDSKNSLMSEHSALEFMAGYIDPSVTFLISVDEESGFSALVNLHPDSVRGRYFTDVYASPQLSNLDSIVLWVIELAQSEHPDWDMWPGVNFLDKRLQSAWANHGFEFLRRYYTMRMSISSVPTIRQIENLEIRAIDITNPDEIALWHKVHQNSFSKHFGFAPRELEKWSELLLDASTDPNGVFLAYKNQEPIGFCQCNDEYADENKGQIAILGVTQENQGLGIGEALLQTGIVYSASKGYDTIELNVDTGNESGALKLYEKLGFKPESSWIQMHRPQGNRVDSNS